MKKIIQWFNYKRVILILVGIGICIALSMLDQCRGNKYAHQQKTIDSLTLANQKLVQDTNRLGQLLVKQQAITTTNPEEIKALTLENLQLKEKDAKRIKQVNSLVKENTKLKLENYYIAYDPDDTSDYILPDTIRIACPDSNYVKVPKKVTDTSKTDFKFTATVGKEGLTIDSLEITDKETIAFVETKGGLFKRGIDGKVKLWRKPTIEVIVTHSNKLISVEQMNSLYYTPKPKARWLERLVIAAASAFITAKLLK